MEIKNQIKDSSVKGLIHMSKGQRAMAVAMIYPEPEKSYPGKTTKTKMLLENKSISGTAVSQARTVLRHLPEMAKLVVDGTVALNLCSLYVLFPPGVNIASG